MRKYLWILFTILCCLPTVVMASEVPEISSEAAILYQLNEDQVIYEKNSEEIIAPASLTKVMTTYVALEKITDLDQTVTLTSEMFQGLAESNASVAGFSVGETVTYRDLLYGSLFPSGGDATQALAILQYDTQENFVARMNEKAEEIASKIETNLLSLQQQEITTKDIVKVALDVLIEVSSMACLVYYTQHTDCDNFDGIRRFINR